MAKKITKAGLTRELAAAHKLNTDYRREVVVAEARSEKEWWQI